MLSEIRPAIVSTVLFTLLLGVAYPLAVTGVSKVAFPYQAGGSLVRDANGQVIGSALLAQPFAKDEYLHPRPSAAGMNGYDASGSSGSNYGPLQADRIAKARGASADVVRKVIADQTQGPALGFLGQPHVNVLMTNLALDKTLPKAKPKAA